MCPSAMFASAARLRMLERISHGREAIVVGCRDISEAVIDTDNGDDVNDGGENSLSSVSR